MSELDLVCSKLLTSIIMSPDVCVCACVCICMCVCVFVRVFIVIMSSPDVCV